MGVHRLEIRLGHCYRTDAGELRLVLAREADVVVYANLFTAGGWTSRGPRQRMDEGRFAAEAEAAVACPAEGQRWRGFG